MPLLQRQKHSPPSIEKLGTSSARNLDPPLRGSAQADKTENFRNCVTSYAGYCSFSLADWLILWGMSAAPVFTQSQSL